jgi:hypothetical protein
MLDRFSGRPTFILGDALPPAGAQGVILDDHWRRLRALDCLGKTAAQFALRTNQDRDLFLAESKIAQLENAGGEWLILTAAIREFRQTLPIFPLEHFGFQSDLEDPFEVDAPLLHRLGGGVEALAFADDEGSVYKFFLFRENGSAGATFTFQPSSDNLLQAESCLGTYRNLLEKLAIINAIGGMPTEVIGITPEGILVAKQTLGRRMPEGTDTSKLLPASLISIPSIFLRCDRDHPRLAFIDFHDRNLVYDLHSAPRIIDLVAAPFPPELIAHSPLLRQWLERVRQDPAAGLLDEAPDHEL